MNFRNATFFACQKQNRLIEVKDAANQTIATFTYEHEGKRTSMTTTSGTTYFHYSGDKVVYETDASNNITAEYTYDPLGNPAIMTKNGVTYYYHVNGHGDVVALTDGSGNIVAEYSTATMLGVILYLRVVLWHQQIQSGMLDIDMMR